MDGHWTFKPKKRIFTSNKAYSIYLFKLGLSRWVKKKSKKCSLKGKHPKILYSESIPFKNLELELLISYTIRHNRWMFPLSKYEPHKRDRA